MLFGGFDAFGDGGHPEHMGQFDDGVDDGVAGGVVFEVADEPLVDLDDVDRELFQVLE